MYINRLNHYYRKSLATVEGWRLTKADEELIRFMLDFKLFCHRHHRRQIHGFGLIFFAHLTIAFKASKHIKRS